MAPMFNGTLKAFYLVNMSSIPDDNYTIWLPQIIDSNENDTFKLLVEPIVKFV